LFQSTFAWAQHCRILTVVKRNYCANLNSVIKAMAVRGGQQKPILGKKTLTFMLGHVRSPKD
jgi:hypothetical protein